MKGVNGEWIYETFHDGRLAEVQRIHGRCYSNQSILHVASFSCFSSRFLFEWSKKKEKEIGSSCVQLVWIEATDPCSQT